MVKILFDLMQVLYSALPLATCTAVLALLSVLLSKSIKKHATVYYIVLGLPFAMVAIPFIGRIFGIEIFAFSRIPFLGGIIRDYIHAGTFGFPLLIIIMYMGALNPRITWVKKLMSIRKELSIISGFPIFAHSLIRVSNNFPRSLKYFTSHGEYMETARIVNEAGTLISNFSFALVGIVLLVIFIPLWITSFDSVHRRMGSIKWKKWQKWSYVLYALLFIHATGIQVGGLLNPRGGGRAQVENVQTSDNRTVAGNIRNQTGAENEGTQTNSERRGRGRRLEENDNETQTESANHPTDREQVNGNRESAVSERDNVRNVQPEGGRSNQGEVSASSERGGHGQSASVVDIKVGQLAKQYIHIISLVLIFGSYLFLRLRKAETDRAKRKSRTAEERT
ncbi:MAG: ferric reductase-like transmembrane domain-containing protein [Tannerellaceae bacterium]|jgi:DMSO/TMAO reductase YedYZ heme-binding membrane subunit|nr:ferric reductase-like transmembrane domain-containing protein [Tannerellaceae bacterium]